MKSTTRLNQIGALSPSYLQNNSHAKESELRPPTVAKSYLVYDLVSHIKRIKADSSVWEIIT